MSITSFTEEELEALESKWTLPRFLFFPAGLFGMWFLANPWPFDHPACFAFWALYTGYVLFCWTSCFHECAHQTLCGSQRVSIWLGRVLGTVMFVPYTVYRESHIRHHAYLNKPHDWELWPYSDPTTSLGFRRMFVWLDLFLGWITAPYIYGRIYFHRDSPLTQPAQRRAIACEYLAIVTFWSALFALVGWHGSWIVLLKVWLVPHMIAGVYQNTRKLTEHLGLESYDPLLGTRTVLGAGPITRLCTYLNFDIFIHGPHHRHPRMAHNQLRSKMQEYLESDPRMSYPIYTSYLRATADMIPSMIRCPGVGMNAGAAPPEKERRDNVNNFDADITREILADADAEVIHAQP